MLCLLFHCSHKEQGPHSRGKNPTPGVPKKYKGSASDQRLCGGLCWPHGWRWPLEASAGLIGGVGPWGPLLVL